MKFLRFILPAILLLTLWNCQRDGIVEPQIGIYVQGPGEEVAKADVGEVSPSNAAESLLHDMRIWVFTSDGHQKITSLNIAQSQLPAAGRTRRYVVPVSREFAAQRPDVDVFVLANGYVIGSSLNENSNWDEVNDAVLSGSNFGISIPVRTVDPAYGLPMTGVGRGLQIQMEEPVMRVETVRLIRAVSKVRYVFCRMKDDEQHDEISVDRITLNGGLIPQNEYLFTGSLPYAIAPGGYVAEPLSTDGPATLAQNETPEKLVYAGQDAQSYKRLLDDAISDGLLTDAGTIYLRESDKMLTGYVSYTVNGVSHTRNFTMANPGDFARNHSWTLYGYFLSGRNLQLAINAQPWDYNVQHVDFSNQSIQATQFVVDDTTADVTEPEHDHFDVRLRAGVSARGHLYITTPVSGKLMIQPIGDAPSFIVTPDIADIDPTVNAGRIDIEIRRNPDAEGDQTGKHITLSFTVESGEREIDANTELLNGKVYRFIL
ncbi:MAG: hypothetical protein J5764_05680 [Bacteroidales bacterium]|nr:hypothetical protein [Bacteroidales bacterium]